MKRVHDQQLVKEAVAQASEGAENVDVSVGK
jgi:hypothetical protein